MYNVWSDEKIRAEVGQHFMVGFPGTELTPEIKQFLAEYKVGNIILFRQNIHDNKQLRSLCMELQQCIKENTGYDALIGIDQEGGIVTRLGADGVNVPGGMAIAAGSSSEGAYLAGRMTGRQLRAVGINFDFAPDLDVNCNPDNPVIGVRSYGDTPEQVTKYGLEMMRGLQDENILACAKHFPGHGDTNLDSHLSLPCVDKPVEELERMEMYPFIQAVKAGVASIMTTHILFPALEPDSVPATMSRRIITGILREKMGYQGLVITDSMEMAAIQTYYGTEEGCVATLQAGVDIAMICHSLDMARKAICRVEQAVREGKISIKELEESTARILRLKVEYKVGEFGEKYDNTFDRKLVSEMIQKSVAGYQITEEQSLNPGANPLFVGSNSYRSSQVSNQENKKFTFADWMAEHYGGDFHIFTADPDDGEIEAIFQAAKGHSALVLGTYNGHLRVGQRRLLKEIEHVGIPILVIAFGIPYDLCHVPEHIPCLAVWEYSERSFEAVLAILKGERKPVGKIPVRLK